MATILRPETQTTIPERPWKRSFAALRDDRRVVLALQLILLSLFYMICVNLRYGPADDAFESVSNIDKQVLASAEGNVIRQLFYPVIFVAVFGLSILVRGWRAFHAVSYAYLLACAWCLLSALWAIEPGISIRRSISMIIILFVFASTVDLLGAKNTIRTLYFFLKISVVTCIIFPLISFIPLFAFAVHPINELDPALIGAWRGIFMHKNVTGAVMAYAIIMFAHAFAHRRNKSDLLFLLGAIIVMVNTLSKTALAWVGVSLFISYAVYLVRVGTDRVRVVFFLSIIFVVLAAVLSAIAYQNEIYAFFSDYENLTGRVGIWSSFMPYIKEHFVLGSGYGSFYGIGEKSPMFKLAVNKVFVGVRHSHSGYFEILLTTGVIGLILALNALIVLPVIRFSTSLQSDAKLAAMGFGVWFFGIVQNLTESQFFAPDKESWSFVVVIILVMHTRRISQQDGDNDWLARTAWAPTVVEAPARWNRRYRRKSVET